MLKLIPEPGFFSYKLKIQEPEIHSMNYMALYLEHSSVSWGQISHWSDPDLITILIQK